MLLDRHESTVLVQQRVEQSGDYGTAFVDDGAPVEVPCNIRAVSAEEADSLGLALTTLRRLYCRAWPGLPTSSLTIDGQPFEQVGEAQWFGGSRLLSHWEVVVKKIGGFDGHSAEDV